MAATTDPRGASFDAFGFRDAIRFAMNMGLPEDENERATFVWDKAISYDISDPAGNPYDYTKTPTKVISHDPVQIPVAVQFIQRASSGVTNTPFGEIDSPHVIVTALDEDYALVRGADKILFGEDVYVISFVKPPDGLFGVTVYTIFAAAEDEA